MHSTIWLYAILILNFGISWWNAKVCGEAWVESKAVGGMIRLLVWCGAIQSAIGFSSVILFPLVFVAHAAFPAQFTDLYVKGAVNLWYLTIIFPVLGTGLIITVHSWIQAYRERDMLSMGSAAWSTYAQIHNMAGAVDSMGSAFSAVGDAFGSLFSASDDDDAGGQLALLGLLVMLAVVIISLFSGAVLTALIIKRYAGTLPMPQRSSFDRHGHSAA